MRILLNVGEYDRPVLMDELRKVLEKFPSLVVTRLEPSGK